MRRKTYQFGWLEKKELADGTKRWIYRYREPKPEGGFKKRSVDIGTTTQYPTAVLALKKAEYLRVMANPDHMIGGTISFGALVERYLALELPELRHSSAHAYRSYLANWIVPKWAEYAITEVKAFAVEQWLKSLDLAPKTKGHIQNLMRVLFNCAMRWELINLGTNPMRLVRVRGVSKREREPYVLGVPECRSLLKHIEREPFRTMVILDLATGLRCSELLALKWCDFDWDGKMLYVRRAIVDGVVDEVKTKYSKAGVPLDPAMVELCWRWRQQSLYSKDCDWVFASPAQEGRLPYRPWKLQQTIIRPAAERAGLPRIGWHTFRHTFSSWLRANGEDIKVQQELLRHADVRTTLNIYTQANSEQKRRAHSRIVQLVLPEGFAGAETRLLPPSCPPAEM